MNDNIRDGVRILVAGGRDANRPVLEFARAFGACLMTFQHPEVVLITGGRTDVDRETVVGAQEALGDGDLDRVVTFPRPGTDVALPFSRTHVVQSRGKTFESRRFAMVAAADAVVAIRGSKGVPQIIALAQALDLPVLPLPFTGGEAEAFARPGAQREVWCRQFGVEEPLLQQWLSPAANHDAVPLAVEAAKRAWAGAAPTCFVALAFVPEMEQLCSDYIVPAISSAGLRKVSTDAAMSGDITQQILDAIERARVVIGLLDDRRQSPDSNGRQINANVMYEVGFAHALGKPTVLITGDSADLPFDLRVHWVITYSERDQLTERVTRALKTVLDTRRAIATVIPASSASSNLA
jgi:nucleoside 2-deoxyribosyltransferase